MNTRKAILSLAVGTVLGFANLGHAGAPVGSWYISPQWLWVNPDSKAQIESGNGYRVAVGRSLSQNWDAELAYANTKHSPIPGASPGDLKMALAELDFKRLFNRDDRLNPFVDLGVGSLDSHTSGVTGSSNKAFAAKLGVGMLYGLGSGPFSRAQIIADLGVRLDTLAHSKSGIDPYAALGLRFNVGGTTAAAAPVIAKAAMPAPLAAPPPPPVAPVDSDGDGVPDNLDKCPNTPPGAKVDANGCELDSDHDGVIDRLDRCPNTPAGDKVDAVGCSLTMNLQVNFDTGSATLKTDSYGELDRFVQFLKDVPSARGELQGHTDSVGGAALNMKLSQHRADAVKAYVISKDIDATRLTTKGFGESQPAASNKTKEGRAENRRVLFVRG